jgi:hypothetical protein
MSCQHKDSVTRTRSDGVVIVRCKFCNVVLMTFGEDEGGGDPIRLAQERTRPFPNRRRWKPPYLGNLWPGPWLWWPNDGVGLIFKGLPINAAEFIGKLWTVHSCHPKLGHRLVDELMRGNEFRTTVMAYLRFETLAIDCKSFGVELTICEPWKDGKACPVRED